MQNYLFQGYICQVISYDLFKESVLSLFEKSKLKKSFLYLRYLHFKCSIYQKPGLDGVFCPSGNSGRESKLGPSDISDITSDLISRDSEKERGKMNKR